MSDDLLNEKNIEEVDQIPESEEFVTSYSKNYENDYEAPKEKEAYIDPTKGAVVDKKDISPFEIIKAIAEQTNTKIKEPRKGCYYCHGRGYMGKDLKTQMPIPCNCIYPTKTPSEKASDSMYDDKRINGELNHSQKRRLKKFLMAEQKKTNKIQRAREKRGYYNPPKKDVEENKEAFNIEKKDQVND
jgi:hypothetical protein